MQVVLRCPKPVDTCRVLISNAPVNNRISFRIDGVQRTVEMQSGEVQLIELQLHEQSKYLFKHDYVYLVTVSTEKGVVLHDNDNRYRGCFVVIELIP